MTVLNINTGNEIRWNTPQNPRKMVRWSNNSIFGQTVKGSLRTIAHLDWMNARALKIMGKPVQVIQPAYNSSVAASEGTHDFDACMDVQIPGINWWSAQHFFRNHGFGCWYRFPPSFPNHIHGFTLPNDRRFATKVGVFVDGGISQFGHTVSSSQLVDYYNHAFGLSGMHTPNSDRSWFPKSIDSTIFQLSTFVQNKRGNR